MGKIRLNLGEIVNSSWGSSPSEVILCKKIHTIIIDDKTYRKNDCKGDSMKIQNFYRFIIKNVDKITYIKSGTFVGNNFSNYIEHYLEKNKLHYCGGFAKSIMGNNSQLIGYYFIDGVGLDEKDFLAHKKRKIWLRGNKLERIIGND